MSPPHREIARTMADELARRQDVLAILLVGSAARGDAVDESDVDLLTVLSRNGDVQPMLRIRRDGVLVEVLGHSEAGWEERFRRARPMWIYAFLEAEALYDSGPAARLRRCARSAYDAYETSEELRTQLVALLQHGEPKLRRALRAGGEQAGYCAALLLPVIVDGLYAAHHRPQPAGSRCLKLLHTLPLSNEQRHRVRVSCTGLPEERISAIASLHKTLTRQLGPADVEQS